MALSFKFEPIRRKSEIGSDGIVVIETADKDVALHAHILVPDFGFVWVTADNCGEGYTPSDRVIDFVADSAKSRLKDVIEITKSGDFSAECLAHKSACEEFLEMAKRKPDKSGLFNMKALSNALWAGEYAIVEKSQQIIVKGEWHYPWCEKVQADWMEWFYTMAYARDEVKAITWWDFKDPAFIPTSEFLNEEEMPKDIYFGLLELRKKF
ncbi:MAG: hypothetical protein ACPL7B_13210 [Candidatus Poribacteria bacterium]